MADGLDIVAVGVADEGAVIVLVIMRPQARRAVVAPTRRDRRLVEGIDGGAVLGMESDMGRGSGRLAGSDPEVRAGVAEPGVIAMAAGLVVADFYHQGVTEWRKGSRIE